MLGLFVGVWGIRLWVSVGDVIPVFSSLIVNCHRWFSIDLYCWLFVGGRVDGCEGVVMMSVVPPLGSQTIKYSNSQIHGVIMCMFIFIYTVLTSVSIST